MNKKIEKSIETIPQISSKKEGKHSVLKLEDLDKEKPRASIKEIKATYKLVKILENEKKNTTKLKKLDYSS
jgi:hypothetical protein